MDIGEGMMLYSVTTGSHDSYAVCGLYIGPKGVDIKALAKEWAEQHKDKYVLPWSTKSGSKFFDSAHFRQFVLEKAGLVRVESEELWLPDYALDMRRYVEDK